MLTLFVIGGSLKFVLIMLDVVMALLVEKANFLKLPFTLANWICLFKVFGTEDFFLPLPKNLDAATPANKPVPCGAVAGV